MRTYDVIICGGGIIGPALGYGIARAGASVLMLDEGDTAFRAARGNFGLVWFQGKGLDCQSYVDWTLESTIRYPDFADQLLDDTGIDIELYQNGGMEVCLSDQEAQERKTEIQTLAVQSPDGAYPVNLITPQEASDILGGLALGPDVVAMTHCPRDGHVNPLKLVHGLHTGFQKHGGLYQPNTSVREIIPVQGNGEGSFTIKTDQGNYACKRVVITAGLGITPLAAQVGLTIPVFPERGQILVTERTAPILPLPLLSIRQTDEGSVMIGVSNEKVGFDTATTGNVTANLARRAVATFPVLGSLNLVRTWGALRVLTPDHVPVYDQAPSFPGAYAATSHSGVTLAASNVSCAAEWILEDRAPNLFSAFRSDRFHA